MAYQRIESPANPRIRAARKMRDCPGKHAFLEGKKLISEAIQSGVTLGDVLLTEHFLNKEKTFVKSLENHSGSFYLVSDRVMNSVSDVESPPGLISIASMNLNATTGIPESFGGLLFSIRNPGNFGTILRAAEASGCEFLSFTSDCVHPFAPKVIRASSGSIFRVPLLEVPDVNAYLQKLRRKRVAICGLTPDGKISLFDTRRKSRVLAVIGSESHGLPDSLELDETWRIPMKGRTESLNAAMAATLCFYVLSRSFNSYDVSNSH